MAVQITGAEGPVSVRAMHFVSSGQNRSGGAKHAPGHRSTSTIDKNGSGASCDARPYNTAEAMPYPHLCPVAVGWSVAPPVDRLFLPITAVIHRSVAADQPCYRRPTWTKLLLQSRNNKFRGNLPCCCICWRNLTTTLEEGRMRTCLLPRFSALVIVLRQSASTDIRTIWEL